MTSTTPFDVFVPVYDVIPESWEESRTFLTERLKEITNAVNVREVGYYIDQEGLAGKNFIPASTSTQEFRDVFRKVIDFGALPPAGSKSVPHGITWTADTRFIFEMGTATQPSTNSFSFNYSNLIKLNTDPTFVTVTVAADFSLYTECFIILEYI